jgi:hypothetical protein
LSADAGRLAHNCALVQENTIGTLDFGASLMTILKEFRLPRRMGEVERSASCHPSVAGSNHRCARSRFPAWHFDQRVQPFSTSKRHAREARSGQPRPVVLRGNKPRQNVERLGGAACHNKFNLSMRQHAYQQLCSIRRCFATDL